MWLSRTAIALTCVLLPIPPLDMYRTRIRSLEVRDLVGLPAKWIGPSSAWSWDAAADRWRSRP